MKKYMDTEDWGDCFEVTTATHRRIKQYAGIDFIHQLKLPYSAFLLLSRDSWVDSYLCHEEGREFLKAVWRLQQTEADAVAIRHFIEEGGI